MREKGHGNKLGQKQIGRLISVFLVLTMLLGIMPVSVFAAQNSDTLSDISEISTIENQQSGSLSDFYNVEDVTVLSDDDTTSNVPELVDGVYQIGTADQLRWFASLINGTLTDGTPANPTANAVLTKDIDLNNEEWTPIGVVKSKYAGTFDGRNHRVTGLYISEAIPAGFFAFADTGSLICNLTVSGNITISNLNNSSKTCTIGGLVANARGDILNCCNEVNITLTNFVCKRINVGGLCGSVGVNNVVNKIVGCTNSGNIYCSADLGGVGNPVYAGGIAGILNFHQQIDSCKNTGSVIVHLNGFGKGCVGGITNVDYVDQPKIEYTPKPQEDGKCHLSLSPNLLFCWNHCGFQQNSCFCQQVQILTGANLRCCPRCWLFSCLGVYFHLRILPESTERSAAAILGRSAPSFLFMVRFRIFCCRQDFPPQFHDNTGTNVFQ